MNAKIKREINDMSYEQMLDKWRNSRVGEPLFQHGNDDYFLRVMKKKREKLTEDEFDQISKRVGWEKKRSTSKYQSATYELEDKFFTYVYTIDEKRNMICKYAAVFDTPIQVMDFLTRLLDYDDVSFMRNIPNSDKKMVDDFNEGIGPSCDQGDRGILSSYGGQISVTPRYMSKETWDAMTHYVMFKPTITISLDELPPVC